MRNCKNGNKNSNRFFSLQMSNTTNMVLERTSLRLLRPKTLAKLSAALNARKWLTSADGKLRDYRGLAEEAGLAADDVRLAESTGDPAKKVVTLWATTGATAAALDAALSAIGRHDARHDLQPLLLADCEAAAERLGLAVAAADQQSSEATRAWSADDALTAHDLELARDGKSLARYDAIVLASEDAEDEEFAWHLTDRLERAGKRVSEES